MKELAGNDVAQASPPASASAVPARKSEEHGMTPKVPDGGTPSKLAAGTAAVRKVGV
jgi:hypothetical protein